MHHGNTCPMCGSETSMFLSGSDKCHVCSTTLRPPIIHTDGTGEAVAVLEIGSYTIMGNRRGVTIYIRKSYSLSLAYVASPNIAIHHFKNISETMISKFVSDGDWHRLEKAQILL